MNAANIPDIVFRIKTQIFDKLNFKFEDFVPEPESSEYAACNFILDNCRIIFRKSKITPKKIGQFVTLWRRNEKGMTQPYHFSDNVEFILISVISENRSGLLIFPKSVAMKYEIISSAIKEGKRGIRVYAPWDKTMNKQAQKTQKWQLDYFLELSDAIGIDLTLAQNLLSKNSEPGKIS